MQLFIVRWVVVIGGRIGYFLFWDWKSFIENPLVLFKIWQGGMAFHGGVLGVFVAMLLFCQKVGQNLR